MYLGCAETNNIRLAGQEGMHELSVLCSYQNTHELYKCNMGVLLKV